MYYTTKGVPMSLPKSVEVIVAIVIGQGIALLVGLYLLNITTPFNAILAAVLVGRLFVRFEKLFGL